MNPINTYHSGEKLICGEDPAEQNPQVNCEQENKKVDTNIPSKTNAVVYYDVASELGCAGGIQYQRVAVYTETGVFSRFDYIDSSGVVSATMPAGFTLGPCGSKIDPELACISNDGGTTIVTGVVVYDISVNPPTETIYLNGTDVTGTYVKVPCEKNLDFETKETCYQDITDPSIKYTRVDWFEKDNLTVPVATVWFDVTAGTYSVTAPLNIQPCEEPLYLDVAMVSAECPSTSYTKYTVYQSGPGSMAFYIIIDGVTYGQGDNNLCQSVLTYSPGGYLSNFTTVELQTYLNCLASSLGKDPIYINVIESQIGSNLNGDELNRYELYTTDSGVTASSNAENATITSAVDCDCNFDRVNFIRRFSYLPSAPSVLTLVGDFDYDGVQITNPLLTANAIPAVNSPQNVKLCLNKIGTRFCNGEEGMVEAIPVYTMNPGECKHTETVYDVITASFSGTVSFTYTAPFRVTVSYNSVVLTNDTIVFYWTDFGDGYNDVGGHPLHSYNTDGMYEIKGYGITSSGNKVLLFAKEVTISAGTILYAPTANPQPVVRTYTKLVAGAFQDYCGNLPVGVAYNADGSGHTLIGNLVTTIPEIIDELEDNADYQALITTTQLTLKSGGVSIANGTLATSLGPDGTIWNNPGNLRSVTIRARRSTGTDAVPGSGANQVLIQTTDNKVVLLNGESVTFSVEDGNIQDLVYVDTLNNSAALVIYNRL